MTQPPFHERVPARLRALPIVAIGLGLCYWQIWIPLHALQDQRQSIFVSGKALALGILLVMMGLLMLVVGSGFERFLAPDPAQPTKLSPRALLVILPGAAAGIAGWIYVDRALEAMGYR
jgi:hypothetical protein